MGLDQLILPIATGGTVAGAVAAVVWGFYARFCVPVPPNRAAVLYGRKGRAARGEARSDPRTAEISPPRIVVGGRAFVPPWDRGVGYLSLQPVSVDVTVRSLHALEGTRATGWEARLSVQAKVPSDPVLLGTAAENLLGKSDEEVRAMVRHAVEGAVPAVLARLRPGEIEPDWERLASEIQASVAPDLVACGLVVRALSVTELVRIAPGEDAPRAAAPKPTSLVAAALLPPGHPSMLPALEVRLSRVERSLGIIGAEIVRLVHEATPDRDGSEAPSVLDFPLGFEWPSAAPSLGSGGVSVHDSIGGDRSPRSRPLSREGATGEGGVARRSLLDAETEG